MADPNNKLLIYNVIEKVKQFEQVLREQVLALFKTDSKPTESGKDFEKNSQEWLKQILNRLELSLRFKLVENQLAEKQFESQQKQNAEKKDNEKEAELADGIVAAAQQMIIDYYLDLLAQMGFLQTPQEDLLGKKPDVPYTIPPRLTSAQRRILDLVISTVIEHRPKDEANTASIVNDLTVTKESMLKEIGELAMQVFAALTSGVAAVITLAGQAGQQATSTIKGLLTASPPKLTMRMAAVPRASRSAAARKYMDENPQMSRSREGHEVATGVVERLFMPPEQANNSQTSSLLQQLHNSLDMLARLFPESAQTYSQAARQDNGMGLGLTPFVTELKNTPPGT